MTYRKIADLANRRIRLEHRVREIEARGPRLGSDPRRMVFAHGREIGRARKAVEKASLAERKAEAEMEAQLERQARAKRQGRANPSKPSRRIGAALSRWLKKQNPGQMQGVTHVRIKTLKGGGVTITPVRRVERA